MQSNAISKELNSHKKQESSLSLSKIMTICIFYHYSGYKNFKAFYNSYILVHMKSDFKRLVSYNRFVELKVKTVLPLMLFLKIYCKTQCAGISFVDSFALKVCHNKRISSHKVFKNIAQRAQTSTGWFYGLKVHFIINHYGEIISFYITAGNVSDNNANLLEQLTQNNEKYISGYW